VQANRAGARVEAKPVAQVGGDVGRLGLGDGDGQRDDQRAHAVAVQLRERATARAGTERDVGGRGRGPLELAEGGAHVLRASAALGDEHGGKRGMRAGVELAPERRLDALRARSRHRIATAGEVVALAHRERHGRSEDGEPHRHDDEAPAADEGVDPEHESVHGSSLAGWPTKSGEGAPSAL
jgi:hypothetical protein